MTDIPAVFVTGTDTGVGKTFVSCALLYAARKALLRPFGMKPVASGATRNGEGEWRNDDAEQLREWSTTPKADYALVNPLCFEAPIAPHLAAEDMGRTIELAPIRAAYEALRFGATAVLVEGVGGWSVPLSDHLMQADLVRSLRLPVVLVVGIRLGCINHAILSERSIVADGFELKGWIANRVDPQCLVPDRVIASLREELDAPLLGEVAYGESIERAAERLKSAIPVLFPRG
ncbi:dethiobiotin synthase [Ahniella affigens]|uniref:ATP-dependent dethiobiotin synthetase BioD n=1 Tax=Ahniella affigens TaxID=2021234 RepID=A0A2P1PXP4_9GAMM|nr:dethiobiotin synthase [Ahniella affigens]AVP99618.1 dethiobiotin synthase [Ahniella affigens]